MKKGRNNTVHQQARQKKKKNNAPTVLGIGLNVEVWSPSLEAGEENINYEINHKKDEAKQKQQQQHHGAV